MTGLTAAYAKLGMTLTNQRWSWSGISEVGDVAVTIWQDEFVGRAGEMTASNKNSPTFDLWKDRLGNRERLKHLLHAHSNAEGIVSIIIAEAKDLTADPRTAVSAFPAKWKMKIHEINEESGEFVLKQFT